MPTAPPGHWSAPTLLFRLFLLVKNRSTRLLRCGFGGLRRRGPVAAVDGALLVAPGGALGLIDRSVVIGVDAIKAFAEALVAVGFGQAGEPVVIGLTCPAALSAAPGDRPQRARARVRSAVAR
jgi:hypothetical protein